jgi:hypothetical protein
MSCNVNPTLQNLSPPSPLQDQSAERSLPRLYTGIPPWNWTVLIERSSSSFICDFSLNIKTTSARLLIFPSQNPWTKDNCTHVAWKIYPETRLTQSGSLYSPKKKRLSWLNKNFFRSGRFVILTAVSRLRLFRVCDTIAIYGSLRYISLSNSMNQTIGLKAQYFFN